MLRKTLLLVYNSQFSASGFHFNRLFVIGLRRPSSAIVQTHIKRSYDVGCTRIPQDFRMTSTSGVSIIWSFPRYFRHVTVERAPKGKRKGNRNPFSA